MTNTDSALVSRFRLFASEMRSWEPRIISAGYGKASLGPDDYEQAADRIEQLTAELAVKDAEIKWLKSTLEPYLKDEEAINAARSQMRQEIADERHDR